jgi:hypothetical protein
MEYTGPWPEYEAATWLNDRSLELYHFTSEDAASKIMRSGALIRGDVGAFGGGIYFADTPQEAYKKAHKKDACLRATVAFHRPVKLAKPCHGLNLISLKTRGFDSAVADCFRTGREYIIYAPESVTNVRRIYGSWS